ncbi:hypothetical protein GIB67_019120 [Kingdonia uniflora]|uniref:RNA uridylyltransferase n=1 Tax=Kingdonia uniflora TaxID=39325 RepID=A0A7J7MZJ4_9MAGN|nr:hypothetical protein GIB67_019120 [Kingdonia uniflora]
MNDRGGGEASSSPSSPTSGGKFLLQLLQNPLKTHQNQHSTTPYPPLQSHSLPRPELYDPAVASIGPSLPFPPWKNPSQGFPPNPWDSQPPPHVSNYPFLPDEVQRLRGLGSVSSSSNGGVGNHHQQQRHLQQQQESMLMFGSVACDIRNQYQGSLDSRSLGEDGVFDSRVNSNGNYGWNHNAPFNQGARGGGDWERQQLAQQRGSPATGPRSAPPGFPQKLNGVEKWGFGNGGDMLLSRLELSRQIDHPGSPLRSNLHSVRGTVVEESLANLHPQVDKEVGMPGLAEQLRNSLTLNDGFNQKTNIRQNSNSYDKELKSDNFKRLWTPGPGGQRARNHRRDFDCRSDIDKMNAPFLTLYESLVPAEEEKVKQKKLLTSLEKLVNKEWPQAQLYLYGSCANSFGVSKSDIDVCLSIEDLNISKADLLLKLADMLKLDNLKNVQALTHARVPIVKLMDPESRISCDICINNVLAVVNTKLLRDYAEIDNRLRQLAFIVKHWAKSRGVNETYRGTLSSYAYVLMCIHFLQQRKPAILPCLQGMEATYAITIEDIKCVYFDKVEKLRGFGARNRESISQLVWAFFDYWAFRHDYANSVISVRTGSILSKRAKDWTRRIGNDRHLICIEDPFEISHDLGRVVDKYTIKVLREEFERAANVLQYDRNPCVTLFDPYVPPVKKDDQL